MDGLVVLFGESTPDQAPQKERAACNRCHTQKLRRIRKPEEAHCERCLRLGKICQFSIRAPRGSLKAQRAQQMTRASRAAPIPTSGIMPNAHAHPDAMTGQEQGVDVGFSRSEAALVSEPSAMIEQGFSWPGPEGFSFLDDISPYNNFSNPRNENPLNSVVSNVGGALHMYSPSSSTRIRNYEQEETQVTVPSPVQQLASLSVAIYECAANLPSRREGRAERPTRFVFEDLFRLTLEFMGVVKQLGSEEVASPSVPYPFVGCDDEPTMLMVLSCHSRLVEIYSITLRMMRGCVRHASVPRTERDWGIVLPRLQVGGCEVSPPLYIDMDTRPSRTMAPVYLHMVLMVSWKLWGQLAEITMTERQNQSHSRSNPSGPLADSLWNSLMGRTASLIQVIDAIKNSVH
ncbi:hypothetical protein EMPG_16657 [Blastomyces silverae]|uniref:Zn(2)-C6 fungal-type domain-containing protein n=1 Tax=Blastomyces silverae TaxID=2060906 RepID=A0A0H1B934_9EURO|nr:hypothetical protein EMPG_16657 [Blastomyces silverae]